MKEKKVTYEIIAKCKDNFIAWEFNNYEEAKEQYKNVLNYKNVEKIEFNEVITEITKIEIKL